MFSFVAAPSASAADAGCAEIAGSVASVERSIRSADCYEASGQPQRALDLLQAALRQNVGDGPEDLARTITIHGRLGQVHAALGEYPAAIAELSKGVDAAAGSGRTADAAPLLNDLGRAYMSIDEPLRGLAAFADGERLAGENTLLRLTAQTNLARAMRESGAVEGFADRLATIRAAVSTLDASPAKISILLSLAELYRGYATDAPSPQDVRRRANAFAAEAVEQARGFGDRTLLADAYGELGASYADLGESERALTATRRAVLAAETVGADDSLYRWEWQSGRLLRRLGREREALTAYRVAIDTLDRAQAGLVSSRRRFRRDVLPLYEQYADLMLTDARQLPPEQLPAALQQVQQTVERLRVAEVRNYFENQCAVPEVFDASRPRPDNVVVIYPLLFADRTELLVSARDKLFQFTVRVPLDRLTSEIRLLRTAIEDPASGDAYLADARRLYDWLIAPLEPLLREAEPDTIVFVPDGPLRTIPLAVLNDGQRFLVERYALATTPGLSLVGTVNAEPVTRALVNGLVEPAQGFPGLPFVAEELEHVKETVPSRVYRDDGFVTATLEKEILDGGYSIVHFATHAEFESDYRRSFLLTHDDVITMDELEDIVGSQRYTEHPVDLLVLSACQTAAGEDRAALGLAGVAVKAGARSALASLWFVNDQSTALLVSEFYKELAGASTKAGALRGAQLLLLNDERYRHPAYWAPFLMIGNWR